MQEHVDQQRDYQLLKKEAASRCYFSLSDVTSRCRQEGHLVPCAEVCMDIEDRSSPKRKFPATTNGNKRASLTKEMESLFRSPLSPSAASGQIVSDE